MRKRALVVGLGIAGMSAAIGLRRAGWTPVIVERAPERRTGGYFVALFPEGRQAAADLGIADHLHTRNPGREGSANSWSVDRRGRRRPALGFLDQPGGPAAVLRGDIEAALWQSITGVEVRFATSPVEITEGSAEVQVLLENADTQYRETFDLVVGADGMRSSVRRIVFGPHEEHLTTWNAMICAFQLKEQVPTYETSDSIIIARAKRAVWVFGLADHAPTALLTYRTRDIQEQFSGSRVERLRAVFSGMDDPVVRHVLDSLEEAPDHLFDSVHQVRMPRWSTGRVVLVGDAAWCMNLYSGMGATSSLRGGAALGAAVAEHPDDLAAALDAYETGLRPFITKHQRSARLKQQMFVPSSRRAEALRSVLVGLARRIRGRRLATEAGGPQVPALSGTSR
ncbi:FAD-dependent monooxygenase [Pseudonocardia kunmingensis]|uniref:2-polyprenyl-6-methoxyphenol hydroxylase-like FAD-dependent oxidoreductase n=1 Tax=Pseudonocardia kunmingensis TaxID=630975 RepID=A0A543DQ20_9PSEU|nr:FAD-dependent monooxygenase [Pseudonocardia kunmingensis]TQM11431.1 2-polyprenyl-6-methoxyphenol hydroxylase-like FAD-dependent oxidoreductase [Pseudonocardia kunmingensis]